MTTRPDAPAAFQDCFPDIHCFGCGPHNENGLRIKSRWSGPNESICRFTPAPHHSAGSKHYLNGGIIATLIDCHCVCTAMAEAYRRAGRSVGEGAAIYYVTGALNVSYLAPTPIAGVLTVVATIEETTEKKTVLSCVVRSAGGEACARGEVVAVRVPESWRDRP